MASTTPAQHFYGPILLSCPRSSWLLRSAGNLVRRIPGGVSRVRKCSDVPLTLFRAERDDRLDS
jgi:hypothetical protein